MFGSTTFLFSILPHPQFALLRYQSYFFYNLLFYHFTTTYHFILIKNVSFTSSLRGILIFYVCILLIVRFSEYGRNNRNKLRDDARERRDFSICSVIFYFSSTLPRPLVVCACYNSHFFLDHNLLQLFYYHFSLYLNWKRFFYIFFTNFIPAR